jgi:uncharacterized membrane protein
MKEVYEVSDEIFSALVAVDVIVANVWMGCILYATGRAKAIDAWVGADTRAISDLKSSLAQYQASVSRVPGLGDLMAVLGVGFGVTALSHAGADFLSPWLEANAPGLAKYSLTGKFFWIVVLATTSGLVLCNTRARLLEGVGASRVGSAFLYVLVASIGMKMDLGAILENPGLFAVGGIWIAIHAGLLLIVGYLIKAPLFFLAVGSQANVGGAASAPVVASAFHPALAPVGVLLAVLGYALGTYAAWFCGQLMQWVTP